MKMNSRFILPTICGILVFSQWISPAYAAAPISPSGEEMTLWQTLVAGGSVMIVIGLLSITALAIIVYDCMTLNADKLAPRKFSQSILRLLETKNVKDVRDLCARENNNIIAKMVLTGLDKVKKTSDKKLVQEAMEQSARIDIGNLWQNINYLSDIVAVAPLLGLLGTVLGMIQAFHAVPLQSAGLKTTLLAAGISKAMVTTASGLIVAIPVLMAYSFFRGRVQEVTNAVETYSPDIIKSVENL